MIAFAAVALLAGCAQKEEGPVDPYSVNWLYFEAPLTNSFEAIFSKEFGFLDPFQEQQNIPFTIRTTKPAPTDSKITVSVDESLVAVYNEANGTDYQMLSGVQIAKSEVLLKKGEYLSIDTLRVTHLDHDDLMSAGDKTYLIPITVTDLPGSFEKSERAIFYLFYTVSETTALGRVEKDYFGTQIDRSAWKVTYYGYDITSTVTADSGYQSTYQGDEVFVDLGDMYDVKCFGVEFDYSMSYAGKSYSLAYSEDGVTYTDAGEYFNDYYQLKLIVKFFRTLHCRYIKITIGEPYSWGCDLDELRATVAE